MPVDGGLGRGDLVHKVGGHHQPPEPEAGRETFAGCPGVDDVLRLERLHGPDRLAVVAEFAVVVVLDEQPAGPRGPVDGPAPPLGGERAAQRELVGRGQQRRIRPIETARWIEPGHGPGPGEDSAALVHRQRPGAQPVLGHDAVQVRKAVRLHGQGRGAPAAQRPADQAEALGEPRADHDPVGAHAHAPRPGQIPGQGLVQFRPAAGIRCVAEHLGRGGAQRPARRRQPAGPGERGHVG